MKKSSMEQQNKNHEHSEQSSYLKRLLGKYAVVAATSVVATVALSPFLSNNEGVPSHAPERVTASAEPDTASRENLEKELMSAFITPPTIEQDSVRDTHEIVTIDGRKRGTVKLHINNTETNPPDIDQSYFYEDQPVVRPVVRSHWESSSKKGDVVIHPSVDMPPGPTDYTVGLSVDSYLPGGQDIKALYKTGGVRVEIGDNNKIESVTAIPPPDEEERVEIITGN
jgi:hypothetical protein